MVSIVGCILSRFFSKVACTGKVVAVSSCSCYVVGLVFVGSSIYTVCTSANLVFWSVLGHFLRHCVFFLELSLSEGIGSLSFRVSFRVIDHFSTFGIACLSELVSR